MKRLISLLVLMCLCTLPAFAATSSGCPTSPKNFLPASNVAATFSNDTTTNTTTYTFISLTNEDPINGVPGLVKYCVYPSPATDEPTAHEVQAVGFNNQPWIFRQDPKEFAFVRPGGNKTNIPLDGKTTTMGTATFSTLPTDQAILLHIADQTVCATVYPGTTSPTCFVKPSSLVSACNIGEGSTVAAYNAIPFGGVNCGPPSVGVEAYGFNELGDQVTLAAANKTLVSLTVLFTSYGCSVSGHWYSGDCVTNTGDTFTIPITANIYDSAACSGTPLVCSQAPLASVTLTTPEIPYRPSADNTKCTGADAGKWFNPLNGPNGACQYSIGKLLTFDFSSQNKTLPSDVVWTVAYNTSHSGYKPIATPLGSGDTCETSAGGCGYDSLNVGIKNYSGAPYAGSDPDNSVVFINWWQGSGVPQYPSPFGFGVLTPPVGVESTTDAIIPSWTGYRPLGEIITK